MGREGLCGQIALYDLLQCRAFAGSLPARPAVSGVCPPARPNTPELSKIRIWAAFRGSKQRPTLFARVERDGISSTLWYELTEATDAARIDRLVRFSGAGDSS